MSIQVKKITLTPANIFAMFVSPLNVLPAPAAGKVNVILGISQQMIFNANAYTGASFFFYQADFPNYTVIMGEYTCLPATFDVNCPVQKIMINNTTPFGLSVIDNTPFATKGNFFISTDATAATGDSNIDIYIIYEVKTLD